MANNNQIIDGFSLNPYTVPLPYRYFPAALAQMNTLRRANTYRPRGYAIPDDFNQPLQAYETLEYQIKVTAGAYLWGMRFMQYSSGWAAQTASNVVMQITEVCTGIPLFREFAGTNSIALYSASPQQRGIDLPHILTQPRLFLEPADINVELCNLSSAVQRCQLILHFAEGCELVEANE